MPIANYHVVPIVAPTDEEAARHYLWRFWRHIPRDGMTVVFDRTWYGRVLVERVEGYASEDEWRRAYGEINDFESHLCDHGIPVLKFWLHLSQEEQLRRFEARTDTPYKKYKLTDDDYRNRQKWPLYERAGTRHGHADEHSSSPLASDRRQRQAVGTPPGARCSLPPLRGTPRGRQEGQQEEEEEEEERSRSKAG